MPTESPDFFHQQLPFESKIGQDTGLFPALISVSAVLPVVSAHLPDVLASWKVIILGCNIVGVITIYKFRGIGA